MLKRSAFERLCRQQPGIYRRVNRNVIQILEPRLQESRSRHEPAVKEREELEKALQEMQAEAESLTGG